jgi:uncharacterized protein YbgA (DUF1722 family)
LCDPDIREHFMERVFARHRLRTSLAGDVPISTVMRFHAEHKLQLLAHSPRFYASLGRLVATARSGQAVIESYRAGFQQALAAPVTRGRHVNVLEHVAGYFTKLLNAAARRELRSSIQDYASAVVPLVVPIELLSHYAKVHSVGYLQQQSYLRPHPRALRLRDHA